MLFKVSILKLTVGDILQSLITVPSGIRLQSPSGLGEIHEQNDMPGLICLRFGPEVCETVRARISYAFRVFAAVFGYKVLDNDSNAPATCLFYGEPSSSSSESRWITVPARYIPESRAASGQEFSKAHFAKEECHLAFGLDEKTGNPDWLGEIFWWLSASNELGIVTRDSVGRIPYMDTIFGRQGISTRKPHASLLMSWLESKLRNGDRSQELCRAPSPIAGVEHMVVCSHDVDFYYTDISSSLLRLFKNVGISFRIYRSWSFLRSNCVLFLELLGGKRIGDYLPALLNAIQKAGFHSTLFVVAGQNHRRDPNYRLSNLTDLLCEADRRGCSVCLHGSYTSVLGGGSLEEEVREMEKTLGKKPLGSRQHWLRFDNHQNLFDAIERSELMFDSTLGFPDVVGFRNGASFSFPPYNFREERPYNFLEIPLVVMDGSLESEARANREDAQEIADQVLRESRRFGWGGVAALWHNPIEALAVPEHINQVFWKSAEKRECYGEKWMSAEEFLRCSLVRYRDAGLLEGAQVGA